jgi:hypothetical protein
VIDEAAVAERLTALRAVIAEGQQRGDVTLCAVTKGFDASTWRLAKRLGCVAIGENYAQEVVRKQSEVGNDHPAVHFIGQLQTNKVRSLASIVAVWQSVDRAALVTEIAKRAPGSRIFVQVNATGEPEKGGCTLGEAGGLVAQARESGLVVEGLMTVGPTDADPQRTRAAFAAVRRCADELGLHGCSMGMTGDLAIALAEGSTMVRIGTALFGPR